MSSRRYWNEDFKTAYSGVFLIISDKIQNPFFHLVLRIEDFGVSWTVFQSCTKCTMLELSTLRDVCKSRHLSPNLLILSTYGSFGVITSHQCQVDGSKIDTGKLHALLLYGVAIQHFLHNICKLNLVSAIKICIASEH